MQQLSGSVSTRLAARFVPLLLSALLLLLLAAAPSPSVAQLLGGLSVSEVVLTTAAPCSAANSGSLALDESRGILYALCQTGALEQDGLMALNLTDGRVSSPPREEQCDAIGVLGLNTQSGEVYALCSWQVWRYSVRPADDASSNMTWSRSLVNDQNECYNAAAFAFDHATGRIFIACGLDSLPHMIEPDGTAYTMLTFSQCPESHGIVWDTEDQALLIACYSYMEGEGGIFRVTMAGNVTLLTNELLGPRFLRWHAPSRTLFVHIEMGTTTDYFASIVSMRIQMGGALPGSPVVLAHVNDILQLSGMEVKREHFMNGIELSFAARRRSFCLLACCLFALSSASRRRSALVADGDDA